MSKNDNLKGVLHIRSPENGVTPCNSLLTVCFVYSNSEPVKCQARAGKHDCSVSKKTILITAKHCPQWLGSILQPRQAHGLC